jgi:hypothetical protein
MLLPEDGGIQWKVKFYFYLLELGFNVITFLTPAFLFQ